MRFLRRLVELLSIYYYDSIDLNFIMLYESVILLIINLEKLVMMMMMMVINNID